MQNTIDTFEQNPTQKLLESKITDVTKNLSQTGLYEPVEKKGNQIQFQYALPASGMNHFSVPENVSVEFSVPEKSDEFFTDETRKTLTTAITNLSENVGKNGLYYEQFSKTIQELLTLLETQLSLREELPAEKVEKISTAQLETLKQIQTAFTQNDISAITSGVFS
jgi:uncharacterized protein YcgL (UPF0745 family)